MSIATLAMVRAQRRGTFSTRNPYSERLAMLSGQATDGTTERTLSSETAAMDTEGKE